LTLGFEWEVETFESKPRDGSNSYLTKYLKFSNSIALVRATLSGFHLIEWNLRIVRFEIGNTTLRKDLKTIENRD
jgi:hypothetical protein